MDRRGAGPEFPALLESSGLGFSPAPPAAAATAGWGEGHGAEEEEEMAEVAENGGSCDPVWTLMMDESPEGLPGLKGGPPAGVEDVWDGLPLPDQ